KGEVSTDVVPRTAPQSDRLPDLDGRLFGIELGPNGIPKDAVAGGIPVSERATKEAKTLQVALYWGDQLLQVQHFEKPTDITIGDDPKNAFGLAGEGLPGSSFTLVRGEADGVSLILPESLAAEVHLGREVVDRAGLKAKGVLRAVDGPFKASQYRLGLHDR